MPQSGPGGMAMFHVSVLLVKPISPVSGRELGARLFKRSHGACGIGHSPGHFTL